MGTRSGRILTPGSAAREILHEYCSRGVGPMSITASDRSVSRRGLLGATLLAMSPIPAAIAQPVPVLGYVAAKNADPKRLEIFKQGLTELGYVEGKNVRIEYREAVLAGE